MGLLSIDQFLALVESAFASSEHWDVVEDYVVERGLRIPLSESYESLLLFYEASSPEAKRRRRYDVSTWTRIRLQTMTLVPEFHEYRVKVFALLGYKSPWTEVYTRPAPIGVSSQARNYPNPADLDRSHIERYQKERE